MQQKLVVSQKLSLFHPHNVINSVNLPFKHACILHASFLHTLNSVFILFDINTSIFTVSKAKYFDILTDFQIFELLHSLHLAKLKSFPIHF